MIPLGDDSPGDDSLRGRLPWGTIPQENDPLGPNGQGRGSWFLAVLGSNPPSPWGQIATNVTKHVAEPILAPESRFWGIRWGNLQHFSRSIRSAWGHFGVMLGFATSQEHSRAPPASKHLEVAE